MDKLDVEERQKIASLQKEKRDAASGIGWMYKGDKPESEEYLLGKKIDKHVEGEEDKKEDEASIIFGERIKANIALDVAAKMREDPLFAIRRKEEESRKKLLENPIRMKELQKLINQQEKEKEKKEKKPKKHKKKDKKRKKMKSRDKSSDSGSDEESDIMKKYLSILTSKHGGEREQSSQRNSKDRPGKNSFKGNLKRESQGRGSKDQGREEVRRDHRQGEANGERGRIERRGGNYREDKFEIKREREEGRQRNRDEDKDGNPRWQTDRNSMDQRGQRRSRVTPEDRTRDNDRDKPRDRKNESPDDRQNSRQKHRNDIVRTKRGREDCQKELSYEKNRSPSSEDNRNASRRRRRESSGQDEKRGEESSKLQRKKKRKRSASSSSSSSSSSSPASPTGSRGHEEPQQLKQYGLIMSKSAEEAARAKRASRSSSLSPFSKKCKSSPVLKPKPLRRQPSPPRRKLTEEEKQQRLEEMMKNAEWREDQRETNVRKYREEDREREKKDNEKQSSGFISSMMFEHASSSSVEDRIRRNKYNIQRTRKDLDKNFTQK
ncbi:hypothetical protein RRG08_064213 [Elysia crispata]|uniref:Uncharacterized protein n=1 Tax=Elysia crispata TaxID=231223 RepID=A0AAE0YE91_9GAST|nr:hypothetical protein RRG08_064213 [Elysia crispata]